MQFINESKFYVGVKFFWRKHWSTLNWIDYSALCTYFSWNLSDSIKCVVGLPYSSRYERFYGFICFDYFELLLFLLSVCNTVFCQLEKIVRIFLDCLATLLNSILLKIVKISFKLWFLRNGNIRSCWNVLNKIFRSCLPKVLHSKGVLKKKKSQNSQESTRVAVFF